MSISNSTNKEHYHVKRRVLKYQKQKAIIKKYAKNPHAHAVMETVLDVLSCQESQASSFTQPFPSQMFHKIRYLFTCADHCPIYFPPFQQVCKSMCIFMLEKGWSLKLLKSYFYIIFKKQPKDKKQASGNYSDILLSCCNFCKGTEFAKKGNLFSCWGNTPLIAHMAGSLLLRAECSQTILERQTCLKTCPFLKSKFDYEDVKVC